MSNLFAKKMYIWIFVFLSILIATAFLITYNAYSTLLVNDFLEKQSFLSSQTAYALGNYLNSLEEQIILFSNRNDLPGKLKNKTVFSSELRFDSVDFSQIHVFTSPERDMKPNTYTDSKGFLGLTVSDIQRILGQEHALWYSVSAETDSLPKTHLTYLKKIRSNDETVGYLVARVEPSSIERILSLYMTDYLLSPSGLFSSHTAALIEIGAYTYPCGKEPIDSKLYSKASNTPSLMDRKYIIQSDTGKQNIRLILSGDAGQLMDSIRFIQQVFLCAYLMVVLLLGICLYLFIRKIDSVMNTLFSKLEVGAHKEH